MSTTDGGCCFICVAKTKTRCSSCAKAGVDVFFCSPQHQKLLWPLHRLFCGPGKANPFKWPPLSQEESRHAVQNLHTPPGVHAKGRFAKALTIAELLRDEAQMPSLTHISQMAYATEPLAQHSRQVELVAINVRIAEYRLVRSDTSDKDLLTLPSLVSPLIYLTQLADVYGTFDLATKWLPSFLHRVSAVALLRHKASARGTKDKELESNLIETRYALQQWVNDEVRPTHPLDAQRFIRVWNDLQINEEIARLDVENAG